MVEIVLSALFVLLLGMCVDPLHILMPSPVQTVSLVLLILAATSYAGLVFRERPKDEREAAHLARSSRGGYLVGIVGLAAVVIYQAISGRTPDKSVVAILAAMVIAKLLLLLWNRRRH